MTDMGSMYFPLMTFRIAMDPNCARLERPFRWNVVIG